MEPSTRLANSHLATSGRGMAMTCCSRAHVLERILGSVIELSFFFLSNVRGQSRQCNAIGVCVPIPVDVPKAQKVQWRWASKDPAEFGVPRWEVVAHKIRRAQLKPK